MENYLKKIPIRRFINPYITRQPLLNNLYLDALSDSMPNPGYMYSNSEETYGTKLIKIIESDSIWRFFEFTLIMSAFSLLFLKRN